MSRQVRRVALVAFLLFAALFLNLNYLQVIRAEELATHDRNARGLIREYEIERGAMIVGERGDAVPIAESVETDGRLRYLRVYDPGARYAHITGYYSFIFGRAELEESFNDFLTGSAPELFARNLADLLAGRQRVGDTLRLTIAPEVQAAAQEALGERSGAVVALEPRTGAVLALWSNPSYDPNRLAAHDPEEVRAAWNELNDASSKPLLNRAVRETYPPGSTFKLITAAAALEAGLSPETMFDDPRAYDVPQTTADIRNFGGGLCNGGQPLTLTRAMEVSCNTTFAQLGVELGADALAGQAERFGFNQDWDFHLPNIAVSRFPKEGLDVPATAQSAIGQRDVRATPLQMAMVASAIAFDGVLMQPRLVDQVEDAASRVIKEYPPKPLAFGRDGRVISPATARNLQAMMVGVVESGSGRAAQIDGVAVAGKTGTAQTGEGRAPTVWFTGFAPADDPRVVVAVVVPDGGDVGDEATGGRVAAPIARAVMQAALAQE